MQLSGDGTVEVAEEQTVTVELRLSSTPRSAVRIELPDGDRVSLSCVTQVWHAHSPASRHTGAD